MSYRDGDLGAPSGWIHIEGRYDLGPKMSFNVDPSTRPTKIYIYKIGQGQGKVRIGEGT